MKEILREKGYKATPARLAILDVFLKHKVPLCAYMVCKKVQKTNEATVYRTLLSLEKSGILKKIDVRKGSMYFELANDHHHHIFCTDCDAVEDFEDKKLEKILDKIIKRSQVFKNVKEHSLELFGICKTCTK